MPRWRCVRVVIERVDGSLNSGIMGRGLDGGASAEGGRGRLAIVEVQFAVSDIV